MIHALTPAQIKQLHETGIPHPYDLMILQMSEKEYEDAYKAWQGTLPDAPPDVLRTKALAHIAWHQHNQTPGMTITIPRWKRWGPWFMGAIILLLLILLIWPSKSHAQFSHVNTISASDGVHTVFTAAPFSILFSGCTVGGTGSAWTVTCAAGGTNNPGGSANQVQFNSAGTAFGGVAFGNAGQVLESNGAGVAATFQDPIVSGPDAPGAVPTKNPVQIGLFDGTDVQRILGSVAGRLSVDVNSAPSTAVTGTFFQTTQPVSLASAPTTPVTGTFWQATQPVSGTFWQATQPVSIASMPSTPVTGTFWQTTQPISGSISFTAPQHTICDSGCASGGASTPADTFSNPTTAGLAMGFGMLWNGTTWDRQYGDKTNGTFVNVKTSVLPTGAALDASLITLDTDLKANVTLHAGANVIGHVIADSGSTTAVTGNVAVTQASWAGGTLGAMANYGTSPGAVLVPGVNAFITNTPAVTGSGNFTVAQATGTNLHAVLDTTSTTAVTQATGTNLHAVLDTTSTTAVTQATAANLKATAQILGNAGAAIDAATGAAPPANAILHAGLGSGATGGFLVGITACDLYKPISVSTAVSTLLVTGVSGRQVRICSINLVAAGADNAGIIEGTGATCGTGTAGMSGGATAATGWNFAANGGIAFGTGLGTIMQTTTAADSVCIITSAAVQLSGGIQYTVY